MPSDNQITVLEATPMTVANLNRLKSVPPHLNLGATELSNGNNGGISFPNDSDATIYGQFDAQITYLEEDGEIVPYVQVYDSSNPTNGWAGYAYVGKTSFHVLTSALAPMAGYVYLYIDKVSNIAEIRIASSIPDIQGTVRKYAYPIAQVYQLSGVWNVVKLNVPGVIHFTEDPRGAFDVDIKYIEETENDTLVTKPYILVYDSSANNQTWAGYIYSGSQSYHVQATTLTPMVGVVYADVNYEQNTVGIVISASLPSLSTNARRWVYAIANVSYNNGVYSVQRQNQPGNLSVTGRWVD